MHRASADANAAVEAGPQDIRLGFAHGALEPEQKTIVEEGGMIDAVGVWRDAASKASLIATSTCSRSGASLWRLSTTTSLCSGIAMRSSKSKTSPATCAVRSRSTRRKATVGWQSFWRGMSAASSKRPSVQQALRNSYFDSLGLPRIYAPRPSLTRSNRRGTDPYARWCGRGGAARHPPIPIMRQ